MARNEAARDSGNCPRANVLSTADNAIIACDVLLAAFGALLIVGGPFAMALMKQWGWW